MNNNNSEMLYLPHDKSLSNDDDYTNTNNINGNVNTNFDENFR